MKPLLHTWCAFLKRIFWGKSSSPLVGDTVPDLDHILRYIKPTGLQNGKPNGSEFLKKHGHQGTSVNWVEYFKGTIEEQIEEIRLRRRLDHKKNGRLARLNVGNTKEFIAKESEKTLPNKVLLSIVKDPLLATELHLEDPSHSLIKGVPTIGDAHGELIGDLIRQCVIDMHPAIVEKEKISK